MVDLGLVLFTGRHLCMTRVHRHCPRSDARLVLRCGRNDVLLHYRRRKGWSAVATTPATGREWVHLKTPA